MKNFERKNTRFSLCGLNCGLCAMYLAKHCGGCGKGNQSCKIAKCSLEQGTMEYCFECKKYPCEKYLYIDAYDSFITHKNQKRDLEKARQYGIVAYNEEQEEKVKILKELLACYNDGRKKTFYLVAVNLMELNELKDLMCKIKDHPTFHTLNYQDACNLVYCLFQEKANALKLECKLRKKK